MKCSIEDFFEGFDAKQMYVASYKYSAPVEIIEVKTLSSFHSLPFSSITN